MSDESTELRHKLEEIERKTAIWRSQVIVLNAVVLAGCIGSAVWMTARLDARIEKVEKGALEKRKTVEAETFIVMDAAGKKQASFGLDPARSAKEAGLAIYDESGIERVWLTPRKLLMFNAKKNLSAFVGSNEKVSGLAVFDREGKDIVFSAMVDQETGIYTLASDKAVGSGTLKGAGARKAETVTP